MASAVKVKSGFALAELDLDRRLKDETSYQQKLRKLQTAMLELEEIYRVERRRGIIALEGWDALGKSGAIQRLPLISGVSGGGCRFPAISRSSTEPGTGECWSNGSKAWPARRSGGEPMTRSTPSRRCLSMMAFVSSNCSCTCP